MAALWRAWRKCRLSGRDAGSGQPSVRGTHSPWGSGPCRAHSVPTPMSGGSQVARSTHCPHVCAPCLVSADIPVLLASVCSEEGARPAIHRLRTLPRAQVCGQVGRGLGRFPGGRSPQRAASGPRDRSAEGAASLPRSPSCPSPAGGPPFLCFVEPRGLVGPRGGALGTRARWASLERQRPHVPHPDPAHCAGQCVTRVRVLSKTLPRVPASGWPHLCCPRTVPQRGALGHSSASSASVPRTRPAPFLSPAHGRRHLCPQRMRPAPSLSPRSSAVPCGLVVGLNVPPRPAKPAAPPFPRSAWPWPLTWAAGGVSPDSALPSLCRPLLGGAQGPVRRWHPGSMGAPALAGVTWPRAAPLRAWRLRCPACRSPGMWGTTGRRVTEVVSFATRGH